MALSPDQNNVELLQGVLPRRHSQLFRCRHHNHHRWRVLRVTEGMDWLTSIDWALVPIDEIYHLIVLIGKRYICL